MYNLIMFYHATDKSSSFFVGDAAGRQFQKRKGDFASTDRKWSLNVGIKFYTPEVNRRGLGWETCLLFYPRNFSCNSPLIKTLCYPDFMCHHFRIVQFWSTTNTNLLTFVQVPLYTPTSLPLLPTSGSEIILFVGYPCLGKTTFFRRFFEPAGYMHVNQDTLKTRSKCARTVRDILQSELSCAVGMCVHICSCHAFVTLIGGETTQIATERLAKSMSILPANLTFLSGTVQCGTAIRNNATIFRCFIFTGSIELAWHNNLYRAFNLPPPLTTKEVSFLSSKAPLFITRWSASAETSTLLGFHELSSKLRRTMQWRGLLWN